MRRFRHADDDISLSRTLDHNGELSARREIWCYFGILKHPVLVLFLMLGFFGGCSSLSTDTGSGSALYSSSGGPSWGMVTESISPPKNRARVVACGCRATENINSQLSGESRVDCHAHNASSE